MSIFPIAHYDRRIKKSRDRARALVKWLHACRCGIPSTKWPPRNPKAGPGRVVIAGGNGAIHERAEDDALDRCRLRHTPDYRPWAERLLLSLAAHGAPHGRD